jgi:hypothetical protein
MFKNSRHSSLLGYVDTIMNILLGYVFLVIIMLLSAKVEDETTKAVENKNEFVIVMDWTNNTDDDMDLWIKDPAGIVGYLAKDDKLAVLQRDNTGRNASTIIVDGVEVENPLREEIINIQKIVAGDYHVNVHYYRMDTSKPEGMTVKVKLVKINPYSVVAEQTIDFTKVGAEKTAFNFHVNDDGSVSDIDNNEYLFVLNKMHDAQSHPVASEPPAGWSGSGFQ